MKKLFSALAMIVFLVAASAMAQQGYIPAATRAGFISQTTASMHRYVDCDSGSDTYTGVSWAAAKKTLSAGAALFPYRINHDSVLHAKGTCSAGITARFYVANSKNFIISGEDDYTTVAGPWTADSNSTSSIAYSGGIGTADQYIGYLVQPTGSYVRMIQNMSTTAIVPLSNWSTAPGNVAFSVVKPKTNITNSSTSTAISLANDGPGTVYFQLFTLSGSKPYLSVTNCFGPVTLAAIVSESTYANPLSSANSKIATTVGSYNQTTLDYISATGAGNAYGVSFIGASTEVLVQDSQRTLTWTGLLARSAKFKRGSMPYLAGGSRVLSILFDGMSTVSSTNGDLDSSTNYASTKFGGGSTYGVGVTGGQIYIGDVDISNATGAGVQAKNAFVNFLEATTGTSNTGAGCYASQGSAVTIAHGKAPTLTGTVGNFSIDNTTEATTWANLDGAIPYSSAAEMTMAKEVQ